MASSKRSRTREAPTPTNISTKSDPEIEKNGTPASPATAFAISVLPVPGGPTRSTPFGILAPTLLYLSGLFRKSTISFRSSFSSCRPATSRKLNRLPDGCVSCARLLPKFIILLPPPPLPAFLPISINSRITITPREAIGTPTLSSLLSFGTSVI